MKTLRLLAFLTLCTASLAEVKRPDQFTHITPLTGSDYFGLSSYNGTGYDVGAISGSNLATGISSLLSLSTTYQAKDDTLGALAGLTISSGKMIYGTGTDAFSTVSTTSFGRGLLNETDATSLISTLGLASLYQTKDATLTALAGLTTSSGKMIYATGSDAFSQVDSTSFGRSVLNAADAAALRTLAGVGNQWTTGANSSIFTNTTTSFTSEQGVILWNQYSSGNRRGLMVGGDGSLMILGNDTGWTGASEFKLDFPFADGQFFTAAFHGASGTVPVVPDISTHAGEMLAVNGTGDDFEWIVPGGLPSTAGNANAVVTVKADESGYELRAPHVPVSGGIIGTATGIDNWLATPSSANLASAITDETGSGALVFANSPSFTTPTIGGVAIPSISSNHTLTNKTISGASNTLSNISLTSAVTGTLPVANGGTGITSLGTGVATWLGTPSLANLNTALGTTLATTSTTVTVGSTAIALGGSSTSLAGLTTIGSTGAFTNTQTALGTTTTDGVVLQNTTAATSGNQQVSPALTLIGQGFKSNATAGSQSVAWKIDTLPVQGSANPSSQLRFRSSINGGALSTAGGFSPDGYAFVTSGTAPYYMLYLDATRVIQTGAGGSVNIGAAGITVDCNNSNLQLAGKLQFQSSFSNTGGNVISAIGSPSAGLFKLGDDAATVTPQGVQGANGSGTDKAGAAITVGGGQSTGTARGGDVLVKTSMSSTTGASLNSYSTRAFYSSKFVDLTETTATTFSNIAVAASKQAGATITATVYASDGTDFQSLTSVLNVNAVNKAGTVTATLTQVDGTTAASAGTLTATFTATANGASVDLKCSATSSLTQTVLRVRYVVTALNSDGGDSTLTTGSIVTP
jgi:hypothetical protein